MNSFKGISPDVICIVAVLRMALLKITLLLEGAMCVKLLSFVTTICNF
jgi:multisubunit Na+/H+ antiporter MnhF subunit